MVGYLQGRSSDGLDLKAPVWPKMLKGLVNRVLSCSSEAPSFVVFFDEILEITTDLTLDDETAPKKQERDLTTYEFPTRSRTSTRRNGPQQTLQFQGQILKPVDTSEYEFSQKLSKYEGESDPISIETIEVFL
jgi:hypothetical protein